MTQIFAVARCPSAMARKTLALAITLLVLGFGGIVPGAAAQGMSQPQGAVPPQQGVTSQNSQQNGFPKITPPTFPLTSQKRKQALVNYNFKQLKKHAAELAKLTQSLQKDLEKSNANVLSLEIVRKAAKIEKLAKKVKSEAKGY